MSEPAAVVLSHVLTGYATIRGLHAAGVTVEAVTFDPDDPVHHSRLCRTHCLAGLEQPALLDWLQDFGSRFMERPVLLPTSDADALLLARHRALLEPHFRIWTTGAETLEQIIRKDGLARLAESAGIANVPGLVEPDPAELADWADSNPGPYLVKPFYQGMAGAALATKNERLEDRAALLAFTREHGTRGIVVQRMLRGGDGHVFDCYGLCNADGAPLVMASHRRWRQMPPHQGWTSFGEIPAAPDGLDESVLFERTRRLLGTVRYHGIFGIEWLQDRESGELYPIDFNARPFSSIGHLHACGLNLPALAWQDLTGRRPDIDSPTPTLRHRYWVDLVDDLRATLRSRRRGEASLPGWAASLLRVRSVAWWSWRDPGPALARARHVLRVGLRRRQTNAAPAKSS